jgi:hypothetical protein
LGLDNSGATLAMERMTKVFSPADCAAVLDTAGEMVEKFTTQHTPLADGVRWGGAGG